MSLVVISLNFLFHQAESSTENIYSEIYDPMCALISIVRAPINSTIVIRTGHHMN